MDNAAHLNSPVALIADGVPLALGGYYIDYFGFSWTMENARVVNDESLPTIAGVLSEVDQVDTREFMIDYSYDLSQIVVINSRRLSGEESEASASRVRDRTVIIGNGDNVRSSWISVPGRLVVPSSYVAILAAETFSNAPPVKVDAEYILLATFLLLIAVLLLTAERQTPRRIAYILISTTLIVLLICGPIANLRLEPTAAGAFLLTYSAFRVRVRWKDKIALKDIDTGLWRLRAFEQEIAKGKLTGHIIVARIHGFEQVLKTLQKSRRTDYIFKIVDRLRATDAELELYNDNHYFAWHTQAYEASSIIDHLEGLRALFAAPLMLDGRPIDVGITFGIASLDGDQNAVVPSAVAAAEEASEAENPIVLANSGNEEDLLWNISMRARIDAAMERGEIYCLYQPKVDAQNGDLFGVEALVRWEDPERGSVSPAVFVPQCEKAGRMEDLTRYVLQSACSAGSLLHARDRRLSMSVNVSATMLNNTRIVSIVREVLSASRFNPNYLVLEVTETARISDLALACDILTQLKLLGIHISMDDFGVGAANFETFYRLPFDELKIDRLFVSNIVADAKARAIASSLITMGNEARIAVVAEGVETQDELDLLMSMGCTQVQGFALSYPISLSKLLKFDGSRKLEGGQAKS